jgi:cysteine desulfurase family protein
MSDGGMNMIYLDNAATTWPKPESVYRAVDECLRAGGNPGRGGHSSARKAAYLLYEAREEIAGLFGIDNPTNISFTHNATDALNIALFGVVHPGDLVVTTAMEHNAVARPLRYLESLGARLSIVTCDTTGNLDLAEMEKAIKAGAKVVIMSHASNVTGTIMPIHQVGKLAARYGAVFIVDAAQTGGVEEIQAQEFGIDLLAFSGHKGLFGPQGTGGLYVRDGLKITPLRYGGTGSLSESDVQPEFMPDRLESGTPNTPGIAGLLAGVKFIQDTGRQTIQAWETQLSNQLITGLKTINGVTLYGPEQQSARTAVVSFIIDKWDSGALAHHLDKEFGIACRAGLHCAPWAHQTIGTLRTGTVRFSPGYFNTAEEIKEAIQAVQTLTVREGIN